MRQSLLATAAFAALLAAGPVAAVAQTGGSDAQKPEAAQPDSAQPEQQQQQVKPEAEDPAEDQAAKPGSGSVEFIASQEETDWLADSLIGRRVQNASGEDLGGVSDLLLDRSGNVVAVLVGVGGFLGIGGKDVAVRYDDLEFKKRSMRKKAGNDAREDAGEQNTRPPSSSGSGDDAGRKAAGGSAGGEARSGETGERKDPEHRDHVIVLNATKEQLETAPAFKRLGDIPGAGEQDDEPATGRDTNASSEPEQQE